MFEVIPGILEKEWSEIERKIEIARTFAKTIHVDIIDGKFSPNATFLGPKPFAKYKDLFLELHMMVDNPIQYLKSFAGAGFKRFIGHVEMMPDQAEFVAQAQILGEVGLAVDGPTDLSEIKVPYADLDSVLVMTIKAGKSGQTFDASHLEKIKILKLVQDDNGGMPIIEVDGGINDVTIVEAKNAGANRFVANSALFNNQNSQEQYNFLKKCLE